MALVAALALCVKALVPAGYMVEASPHLLTLQICADAQGQPRSIALPQSRAPTQPAHVDGLCAFAALAQAVIAPVRPAATAPTPQSWAPPALPRLIEAPVKQIAFERPRLRAPPARA